MSEGRRPPDDDERDVGDNRPDARAQPSPDEPPVEKHEDEDLHYRRITELVSAKKYRLSPRKIALAILERSAPEVYAILRASGEADE